MERSIDTLLAGLSAASGGARSSQVKPGGSDIGHAHTCLKYHCHRLWHAHISSTQPCIPPGSLNRVPASAGVRAGMSPLPGGR